MAHSTTLATLVTTAALRDDVDLESALAPVRDELAGLADRLVSQLPSQVREIPEAARHLFGSGGKRVRPALFLLSSRLVGYQGGHRLALATACEYVHTASLLHDDVVDNSTLRRGRPTVKSIWGDQTSVLLGDVLCAVVSEQLAASGRLDIVMSFARVMKRMGEGELMQLAHLFDAGLEEKTYLEILACKTASLMAISCAAAAMVADAGEEKIRALEAFGHAVGMAFQLIDDALDYNGLQETVGKPTGSDLLQGQVTLPLIRLLSTVGGAERSFLCGVLEKGQPSRIDIDKVVELVKLHRTDQATMDMAEEYTGLAMSALDYFAPGPERENLTRLAVALTRRRR